MSGGNPERECKTWAEYFKLHPAANLFPMFREDKLEALGADIEKKGILEKIVLFYDGD